MIFKILLEKFKMDHKQLKKGVWDEDINRYPLDCYTFITKCGYKGEIKRNFMWIYCGYVYLPEGHPDFHKSTFALESEIVVHGDLTFGSKGKFGFDCGHSEDLIPIDKTIGYIFPYEKHYWTFEEVKREIENMARQFKLRELS